MNIKDFLSTSAGRAAPTVTVINTMTERGKKIQKDFSLLLDLIRLNATSIINLDTAVAELAGDLSLLNQQLEVLQEVINNSPSVAANESTDYNIHITGARNGINKVFGTRYNFTSGTMSVWLNGLRQTPGTDYDFVEVGNNSVFFTYAPEATDKLIFNYSISI